MRLKPQYTLIALSIGIGIFVLLYLLPMILLKDVTQIESFVGLQELERVNNILSSADYVSIIGFNLKYFGMNIANAILVGPFSILPIMLFGIYAHQINWFNKIKQYKNLYMVIGVVVLILGLAIKMIQIVLEGSVTSQLMSQMIGGPIVALSYIMFFVILCERSNSSKNFNAITIYRKTQFNDLYYAKYNLYYHILWCWFKLLR